MVTTDLLINKLLRKVHLLFLAKHKVSSKMVIIINKPLLKPFLLQAYRTRDSRVLLELMAKARVLIKIPRITSHLTLGCKGIILTTYLINEIEVQLFKKIIITNRQQFLWAKLS